MNRDGGDDIDGPETVAPPAGAGAGAGTAAGAAAHATSATLATASVERYVVIVGFGLAGRAVVNNVIEQGVSYTVVESNAEVVERCLPGGLRIIHGDARDAAVLREAGIARASDVAVTVPNDDVVLAVVEQARKMNTSARIIARCTFVSGGMEAERRGATEAVIAEQVVATEFGRVILAALER